MHKKIKINFKEIKPKGIIKIKFIEENQIKFVEDKKGEQTLQIGIGKFDKINRRKFILIVRKVIRTAKQYKLKKIAVEFNINSFVNLRECSDEEILSLIGQNLEMANFEFVKLKTKPKEGWPIIEELYICDRLSASKKIAFVKGQIIGEYVNFCRELSNTPGGDMTPTKLAKEAQNAAKNTKIKVTALSEIQMEKLKMGAILGVSKGSDEEAKLIIMEYWGAGKPTSKNKGKEPLVLVGKGITFDSGGLSLKPADPMLGMHHDMAGGSAVISSVLLADKLKLKKNVIAIVPAVENMPSGKSYRPGDVLTSMSGKTIEIINTDAEGRVVLADGITYAEKFNPRLIVDVATLTGAALVALGERASAIMTRDQKLQDLFMKLSEESGDYMWPLPIWEEYEEDVKGTFGDVANSSTKTRWGGAIQGGMFLYEFARDLPWVHIDIAPRMTTVSSDQLAKGAAGEPVRFLLKLIEEY